MGIAKSFTKNSIYQTGYNLVTKIAGLILVILLAALLSPEQFGIYSWIVAIALFAAVFSNAGTDVALVRYLSVSIDSQKQKAAGYFKFIFKIRFIAMAAITAVLFFFSDFITSVFFGKPFLSLPLKFASIYLVVYTLTMYLYTALFAVKQLKYLFFNGIIESVLKVILTVGLVLIVANFFGAIAGIIFATIAGGIYMLFVLLKKYRFLIQKSESIKDAKLFQYLKFSVMGSFGWVILTNIDLLMVSSMLSIESVGFYKIALAWSAALGGIIPISLFFPYLTELAKKPLQNLVDGFTAFFKYLVFLTVPVAFGLAFISQQLISFFYRSAYEIEIPQILFVLSFLIIFNGMAIFLYSLFNSIDKPSIPSKVFIIVIILNILLNYFFIQAFGLVGAAYATVIAFIALDAILLVLLKPFARIKLKIGIILKPFIAAGIAFALLLQLPVFNFFASIVYLIAGAIIYFAIMLAIKGISIAELMHLKNRILRG